MMSDDFYDKDSLFGDVWSEKEEVNASLEVFEDLDSRYEIGELLGQGAMKKVYKAYDKFACRYIAFAKLAQPKNIQHIDLFLYEARLTSQLDHPNIIQVHNMGLDQNDEPFFTMDLKEGTELKAFCLTEANDNKDLYSRIQIFLKVCMAMSYAHSKGIIHLDLKPANVRIGSYDEVTVSDWGLGTITEKINLDKLANNPFYESLVLTKPTERQLVGSPGFMAPEQFDADQPNTEQSDVFSLGAILYYLMTGHAPFEEGTIEEIKEKTFRGEFKKAYKFNKKVPPAIDALYRKL